MIGYDFYNESYNYNSLDNYYSESILGATKNFAVSILDVITGFDEIKAKYPELVAADSEFNKIYDELKQLGIDYERDSKFSSIRKQNDTMYFNRIIHTIWSMCWYAVGTLISAAFGVALFFWIGVGIGILIKSYS